MQSNIISLSIWISLRQALAMVLFPPCCQF